MADQAVYSTLPVRFQDRASVVKHLYIKRHSSKETAASPKIQALFVAGVPCHLTQQRLHKLFETFGKVDQVQLHPLGTSAIVVYHQQKTVEGVLKAARKGLVVEYAASAEDGPRAVGLRARVEAHKSQYPGNTALQDSLNEWMEKFENAEELRRKAAEKATAGDGWTVVVKRAGRKRNLGNAVSGGLSLAAAQARAENKKTKVNERFYRFQAREKKKNELVDLQLKFQDAQKRLQSMRATRRAIDN